MKSTTKVRAVTTVAAPVSAVGAAIRVATNPWRVERRSFGQFYHRSMKSKMWLTLTTVVDKCDKCVLTPDNKMFKSGQTTYSSYTGESKVRDFDSHCQKHWKQVKDYQDHIRGTS